MKKYKLWEVVKMMAENKDLEFTNGSSTIGLCNYGFLEMKETRYYKRTLDENIDIDSEWELVQKPVTFNEVLNSGRKCRVEHELMDALTEDECCTSEALIKSINKDICEGKYLLFGSLFLVLSWRFATYEVKRIIKEGKWYLED
ncbi:hypothetical protein [Clostridium sp. UBA4395]|uniref:hypothetical protein n=1 Tax=Clostridium sp. UBA4395 TaxID=1946360 RepID=UPI0032164F92